MGISPSALLRADPVERELLIAAMAEAHAYLEARDERLARLIINELGHALKRR